MLIGCSFGRLLLLRQGQQAALRLQLPRPRLFTVTSNSEVPAGEVSLRYELEPTGEPDFAAGKGVPAPCGVGVLRLVQLTWASTVRVLAPRLWILRVIRRPALRSIRVGPRTGARWRVWVLVAASTT